MEKKTLVYFSGARVSAGASLARERTDEFQNEKKKRRNEE